MKIKIQNKTYEIVKGQCPDCNFYSFTGHHIDNGCWPDKDDEENACYNKLGLNRIFKRVENET